MTRYRVALVARPDGWQPESLDDVPPRPGPLGEVLCESLDLFEALRRAIEHNESSHAGGQWAVVIDVDQAGRFWPNARLCTPIVYKITSIWWPEGWEPASARDVPNCVWKSQGAPAEPAENYRQAEITVIALNNQCIARPGLNWYVIVAVENEPVAQTVAYDASGTETTSLVRRLHVLRPDHGTHGNCDHCPAHAFPCAQADWTSRVHDVSVTQSRVLRGVGG